MIARGLCVLGCVVAPLLVVSAAEAAPETVYFKSVDGQTEIVGYLFKPATRGTHPAVVMLHGRAGPYSANVNAGCTLVARSTPSPCNATALSMRHQMWGQFWADRGYFAVLADSFGLVARRTALAGSPIPIPSARASTS